MICNIGLYNARSNGTCTPILGDLHNTTFYQTETVTVTVGGQLLFSNILDNLVGVPVSGTCPDNNGTLVNFTLSVDFDMISAKDFLVLQLDLENSWDNANIELRTTHSSGIQVFSTYHNIFTVYGYDLGNVIGSGINYNPDFDIWILNISDTRNYSHFISYYKPFTGQLNCYWATTNFTHNVDYSIFNDEGDKILLSTLRNTQLCLDSSILQSIICDTSDCSSTNSIASIIFTPTFEIVTTCGECNDECTFLNDENLVSLNVNYSLVTPRHNDDILEFWYPYQTPSLTILNPSGIVIDEQDVVQELPSPYSLENLPANITLAYEFPSVGSYIVRGCICINYVNGTDKIYIYNGVGTLSTGQYYMLKSYPNVTDGDFTNLVTPPATFPKGICKLTGSTTPTDWGTDKLFNIYVSDVVPGGNWYQIVSAEADCNLTAWTDGVTTITTDGLVGTKFYLPLTAHDWNPTTWGSTDLNYLISGTYHGGAVTLLGNGYDCAYQCCRDLLIEGCTPYTIQRTECGEITVTNLSTDTATYDISKLESTGFVSLATGTLTAYPTIGYQEIIELEDGVYRVSITYKETTYNEIVFINCAMEECFIKFQDKLICCNPGSNCDDCSDDDCRKKDYYDFNAFSLLMNTYYSTLNSIYNFGYVYSDSQITAMISTLHTIDEYITAANGYCIECNQPCKDCN